MTTQDSLSNGRSPPASVDNRRQHMIAAVGEKAALELGDGCELSDATGSSYSTTVMNGAILVLNGGKTAARSMLRLYPM